MVRSRHGEPTRRDLALQGVVLLVVVLLGCGLISLKLGGSFDDTAPVTAQLESAGGSLRTGVDVKMRGMIVGRVVGIEGDARQVSLELQIDKDEIGQIPANVQARVLPASVFGTSYVDLTAPEGTAGGPSLRAGAVVSQDISQKTVELQTALDSIDTLVDALGPSELAAALHTVAAALGGRGDDLGEAIEAFNSYATRFTPMVPQLRRDLKLLTVNLNAVRRNAPDMLEAADDSRVTLNRFADRQDEFEELLSGASTVLEDSNALLRRHETEYLRALGLAHTLVDAVYDERVGLRDSLIETGRLSATLITALEDGYARVEGIVYTNGPDDYTAADCPRYGSLKGGNCG